MVNLLEASRGFTFTKGFIFMVNLLDEPLS
jgi:hypothetical protein